MQDSASIPLNMGGLGHWSWRYKAGMYRLFPSHSQRNTRTQGMDRQHAKPLDDPRFLGNGRFHQWSRYFLIHCMEKNHIHVLNFPNYHLLKNFRTSHSRDSRNEVYSWLTMRTTADGHPHSEHCWFLDPSVLYSRVSGPSKDVSGKQDVHTAQLMIEYWFQKIIGLIYTWYYWFDKKKSINTSVQKNIAQSMKLHSEVVRNHIAFLV